VLLRIDDIMDRKTARIEIGSPMRLAAEMLVLTQASNLMVVDREGRFIGILSEGDLLHAIMPDFEGLLEAGASLRKAFEVFLEAGGQYADQPIDRLVVRESINLKPDDELLKAATVMVTKRIRRLAVLDGEKFVGSVSRADICWALLCSQPGRASGNGATPTATP
jgi:CBS domain-containing protein